jgi:phage-related protein
VVVSIFGNLMYIYRKYFMRYFQTIFLDEADKFIAGLDAKSAKKVIYNVDLAEQTNDPRLFKKLQNDIWAFRTKHAGFQIRLLAFWDKTDRHETLVLATHGFMKKVDKVPRNEIERAIRIRDKYFNIKSER